MYIKKVITNSINIYQYLYSENGPLFYKRRVCAFHPSCSEYSKKAVLNHGVLSGLWLSFLRLLKCHPFRKTHINENN